MEGGVAGPVRGGDAEHRALSKEIALGRSKLRRSNDIIWKISLDIQEWENRLKWWVAKLYSCVLGKLSRLNNMK